MWPWKVKHMTPVILERISRKRLEIETAFQITTNRKWHMGYQMVTWPMTSPDPKMCYDAVRSAILTTAWLLVSTHAVPDGDCANFCCVHYEQYGTENWFLQNSVIDGLYQRHLPFVQDLLTSARHERQNPAQNSMYILFAFVVHVNIKLSIAGARSYQNFTEFD